MVIPQKDNMEQRIIKTASLAINDLIQLAQYGNSMYVVDYDREADVLYVSFDKVRKADNAIQGRDGIIRRMNKNKIIGLTILNASRFKK